MPAVNLASTVFAGDDVAKTLTLTALTTASNSDYITANGGDEDTFIVIVNADATHDATAVFSAATNGLLEKQGTVTVTVAAATTKFIPLSRLSSARVVNQTGTNKGKIIVNTTIASGGDITKVSVGVPVV